MGGAQTFPDKGLARDVWRSSFSFDDLAAVERNCGVKVNSCGVGLQCIPGGWCPCHPHGPGVAMLPVSHSTIVDIVLSTLRRLFACCCPLIGCLDTSFLSPFACDY